MILVHPLHPPDLHRTDARTPSCTVIIPFCSTISTVSGSLASSRLMVIENGRFPLIAFLFRARLDRLMVRKKIREW